AADPGKANKGIEKKPGHAFIHGAGAVASGTDFASGGHILLWCDGLRTADKSKTIPGRDACPDPAETNEPFRFRRAAAVQSGYASQSGESNSSVPGVRPQEPVPFDWNNVPRVASRVVRVTGRFVTGWVGHFCRAHLLSQWGQTGSA